MKTSTKFLIAFSIAVSPSMHVFGQCASEANVTTFTYNGTTYEVVQENQTWVNAVACAVERGGHLIEINDENEQNAIGGNLPFIDFTNTTAPDGGGGGYLWIGGNDMATEGSWMWDGNNDGTGVQFWAGDASGAPVGGMYNNWGNEPDDYNGQDALAYAITNWPNGLQEEWNDVDISNALYYIIEYPFVGEMEVNPIKVGIVYPNPVMDGRFTLDFDGAIDKLEVLDVLGRSQSVQFNDETNVVDASMLSAGKYFVRIESGEQNFVVEVVL